MRDVVQVVLGAADVEVVQLIFGLFFELNIWVAEVDYFLGCSSFRMLALFRVFNGLKMF